MTKGIEFKVNPERIGFMMWALMGAGFRIYKATYQDSTLEIIKRREYTGIPFTYAHIILGKGREVYIKEFGIDETRNMDKILELTRPYRLPS